MQIVSSINRFLRDDEGTTAVEYGVMLGLILVATIVAIAAAGSGVSDWWNNINSELDSNGF